MNERMVRLTLSATEVADIARALRYDAMHWMHTASEKGIAIATRLERLADRLEAVCAGPTSEELEAPPAWEVELGLGPHVRFAGVVAAEDVEAGLWTLAPGAIELPEDTVPVRDGDGRRVGTVTRMWREGLTVLAEGWIDARVLPDGDRLPAAVEFDSYSREPGVTADDPTPVDWATVKRLVVGDGALGDRPGVEMPFGTIARLVDLEQDDG